MAAQTEHVLYGFGGGWDGDNPEGGLIQDAGGTLYGTTSWWDAGGDAGTVFAIDGNGTYFRVLHKFQNSNDGDGLMPSSNLTWGPGGYLYGTTFSGDPNIDGTVFMINPTSGVESVLYSFKNGQDGSKPVAGVVTDVKGNLYGTTRGGGAYGAGTVFVVNPMGAERVIYTFTGGADGSVPYAGVIRDGSGNLYGTTRGGGNLACSLSYPGCGTVFRIDPSGVETVLHSFGGGKDGVDPWGGLVQDASGNLYGTTSEGGAYGKGTLFVVSPQGSMRILHHFSGADGAYPYSGLIWGINGYFYGTTYMGGAYGKGTVFGMKPNGAEHVVYSFKGATVGDGEWPMASLIQDKNGVLYGTTQCGGLNYSGTGGCVTGFGTVFSLTP
jgi:uncharacterized repeat protein (TIGR03803 family)